MPIGDVIFPTSLKNLSLLPSGPPTSDAAGLLNSKRMSETIAQLKKKYAVVLFDSPPILGVSDASVIASGVDHTIIVVQHRRFPRAMVTRVKQAVLSASGTVLGVVLNNVDVRHDQNYYYYTSYYDYYHPRPTETRRRAPTAAKVSTNGANKGYSETDEY
jgi:Mrp family chromosome partitioning ATPase